MPRAKAAKPTTKGKIGSIAAYLRAQPREVQPILAKVVAAIDAAVPEADPTIAYQMPTWKLNGTVLLHLAAWKSHWALYPASAAVIGALGKTKTHYQVEKDTLRFPLADKVPGALITRIAKARATELGGSTQHNLLKRTTKGRVRKNNGPAAKPKPDRTAQAGATRSAAIPTAVGRPALRALEAAGITTLAEAARRNPLDLAKLHGVGPKALQVLAEAIAARRTRT